MKCVTALQRELKTMPKDIAGSTLAASALAMAQLVDDPANSATSRTMAQARLQAALEVLRDLAPPARETDGLDEIAARRDARHARLHRGPNTTT